jgi:hypothetical protein
MEGNYKLYKRLMKRDIKAIDGIESLEQAKEIIKLLIGSGQGIKHNGLYPFGLDKAVEAVAENSHRYGSGEN